jgi:hypothetical protein
LLCEEADRGTQEGADKALEAFLRELAGIELQVSVSDGRIWVCSAHARTLPLQAEKLNAVEQANLKEQQNYVSAQKDLQAQIEQVCIVWRDWGQEGCLQILRSRLVTCSALGPIHDDEPCNRLMHAVWAAHTTCHSSLFQLIRCDLTGQD